MPSADSPQAPRRPTLDEELLLWLEGEPPEVRAAVDAAARRPLLQEIARNKIVESIAPCDPLELAMLLVNEQYDLVHYAGHGLSDSRTGQTGWVFAADCAHSLSERPGGSRFRH